MKEILIEIKISRKGGLVGRTEKGDKIKLSLPSPEGGLLGKLPDEIQKIPSPQCIEWIEKMIREKIFDNPPYPDYIKLNSAIISENRMVIIPYDNYSKRA